MRLMMMVVLIIGWYCFYSFGQESADETSDTSVVSESEEQVREEVTDEGTAEESDSTSLKMKDEADDVPEQTASENTTKGDDSPTAQKMDSITSDDASPVIEDTAVFEGNKTTENSDTSMPVGSEPGEENSPELAAETDDSQAENDSTATDSTAAPVQLLDKMVVSATRTRRKISETPASVSVITSKDIELSPAKDINDLIANETSVQVRRYVGMGEGVPSDIMMRGIPGALAATRTLILVDGIPTNASGTPFLILNEIPVEIIESIEIVRGPYSSLYGANAFGGVINVVTKRGDGPPGGAAVFETGYPFSVLNAWLNDEHIGEAARTGAKQALWNGDIMSSGGNEKINYLVNGGYRTIGNYFMNDSALVKTSDTSYFIPAENYDYTDTRLFGMVGYRFSEKLSLDLHARYFKSDLGFGYTRYSPDTVDIDIAGYKLIIGPQLNYTVNDAVTLRAVGYGRQVVGSYADEMNSRPIVWEANTRDWQIDLQGVIKIDENHILSVGSEYLINNITFGDVEDASTDTLVEKGLSERITNGGAYLQDEIALFDRLHLVPGLRVDYHSEFGMAFSPKLGVSHTFTDRIRARGSAGRAFRAPNHTEMFMPRLSIDDNVTLVSNPDLQPEYIWAFDAGVDFNWSALEVQLGGFYNNMKDLIGQGIHINREAFLTGVWKADVTHDNISSAWSAGGECETTWKILRGLSLTGSYTFMQSRNNNASDMAAYFKRHLGERSGTTKEDIPLDYIPTHKGSIGFRTAGNFGPVCLSFTFDELIIGERYYLNFGHVQIGDENELRIIPNSRDLTAPPKVNPPLSRLPSYARTDLMLQCRYQKYWLTVAVQNLFNAEYEESFGTLAPRQLATVKIGASF